jgi:hypothetical protein
LALVEISSGNYSAASMGALHGLHSASQPENAGHFGVFYSFEPEQTTLYKRRDISD